MPGTQYIGKAGHLAVMAELALRGYNVAMPEMDIGDDVFAVNDATGAMWRIQVKTATAVVGPRKIRAQFSVRRTAITTAQTPELHFVFVYRENNVWRFIVVSRAVLEDRHVNQNMGSIATKANGDQTVTFAFSKEVTTGASTCSGQIVTPWVDNWTVWPTL